MSSSFPARHEIDPAPGIGTSPRPRTAHTVHLAEIDVAADLAAYFRREREAIATRLLEGGSVTRPVPGGIVTAIELSDLTDAVITRLFELACNHAGVSPALLPIAIIATGGYGRRELAPFSDIDITFVPQRENDARTDRVIREMFRHVMDICNSRCGLEVGYAYRLLSDCAELDHQTTSGLLDARLVVGSSRLFIQFEDAFWAGFNGADFIFTKLKERQRALQKWGDAPYLREPQLKEGPGGLRDLHTMVWLVQARKHLSAARVRGDRAVEVLGREADLSDAILSQIAAARERLLQVRCVLHAAVGAGRDLLVVTRQEQVASLLGYTSQKGGRPPIEQFMADLYPALATLRRVGAQVMDRVENSRLILGIGLDCKRRRLVPANGALETDDPAWMLWAFELAQRYDLAISAELENAARALVEQGSVASEPSALGPIFSRILSQSGRVYATLQKMADLGVLGWFLPEFQGLMDLIPYDPAHDFTVGQHTLYVIRNLEDLLQTGVADTEELVEMRRVMRDLPHPEHLLLAALLHDSGKADPSRPHSETGEEIARVVSYRLGWTLEAGEAVAFLVRHHLLMAETSRLRDLNLDETIAEFTRVVSDPDRLNMLYLLTYADTRAVGEGVWTSVKGHFLRELWQRAWSALSEEAGEEAEERALTRARRRLLKDMSLQNLPEPLVIEHFQAMPTGYLLNQPPNRIALHIDYVRRVRNGETVIDFFDDRNATYTELTVCTYDDPEPGLLARITSVLYGAGLVIHGAQVMTRVSPADRIALDVLWVDYRGRQLSLGKQKEVASGLNAALRSVNGLASRSEAPPQPARHPDRSVSVLSVRNDLSGTLTVIETEGPDEQGALYWSSAALAHLNWDIQSARVTVWQGQARAVFYVAGIRDLAETEVQVRLTEALDSRDASDL